MARRSRKEIEIEDEQLLSYMNPLDFGTEKDPCFGKLFSLTAEECTICGDATFCASRYKLRLAAQITDFDDNNPSIKLQENKLSAAEVAIKQKVERGVSHNIIVKGIKKRYNLPTFTIKELITKFT